MVMARCRERAGWGGGEQPARRAARAQGKRFRLNPKIMERLLFTVRMVPVEGGEVKEASGRQGGSIQCSVFCVQKGKRTIRSSGALQKDERPNVKVKREKGFA